MHFFQEKNKILEIVISLRKGLDKTFILRPSKDDGRFYLKNRF